MDRERLSPNVRRRYTNQSDLKKASSDSNVPYLKKVQGEDCESSSDTGEEVSSETDDQCSPKPSKTKPRPNIHERSKSPQRNSLYPDLSADHVDFTETIRPIKPHSIDKGMSPKPAHKTPQNKENERVSNLPYIFFPVAFVFAIVVYLIFFNISNVNSLDISHNLKRISQKFPIQNKLVWDYLQSGIERLINEEKEPAVFILLEWTNENNTAFNIAQAAGDITIKNISSSLDVKNPIVLDPTILNSYDRGEIIDLYKKELENRHVLIVKDMEKVIPEIIQDFRYFCDEDNPLVGKSVIFFLMNANVCENATKENVFEGSMKDTLDVVETCLSKIWGGMNGLDDVILYPVLSRIVNVVLPIQGV